MGLGDFQTALAMRDVIQTLVAAEVERQRPRYQYATVTSIDRTTRRCSVQFPGEAVSVSVSMGSVQPSVVGQVVRIDGLAGDRFVSDVIGDAYLQVATELGANVDFNTLTKPGWYSQTANAEAATATNSPTAYAGLLEVTASPTGTMVWQRYTIYKVGAAAEDAVVQRTYYNGAWSPWEASYYDSDWVDLTPASGWTSSPTSTQSTAQCRRVDNRIVFRGVLNGSLAVATTTTVATVPTGYRPSVGNNFCGIGNSAGCIGWSNVTDTGVLSVHFKTPWAGGTTVLDLTGISYMIN